MKSLFEGFRRWTVLEEGQLLAEGRLDDVREKYPDINAEIITALSVGDPSSRNKYLMWMAKQLHAQLSVDAKRLKSRVADDERALYSDGFGTPAMFELNSGAASTAIREIVEEVEKFHKNIQRLKDKDLNSYKTLEDLKSANSALGFTDKQKRRKARETAQEGSNIIFENDDFFMVRPLTEEASCYYGQGTGTPKYGPWCIAKTKGQNYFNQYTSEGKSFYMLLMKNLDSSDPGKKIAIVYDKDQEDTEPYEIWNAKNTSINTEDLSSYIKQNILAGHVSDYKRFWTHFDEFTNWPEREINDEIRKVSQAVLEAGEFNGPITKKLSSALDPTKLSEAMDEELDGAYNYLTSEAADDNYNNPAGPNMKDYQALLDDAEGGFEHVYVSLEDYGGDSISIHYDAGMGWELPDDLEYSLDEDGDETDFGDWQDDIEEIFKVAADHMGVYPDEVNSDNYRGDSAIRFDFRPDNDEYGTPDAFQDFLNRISEYDEKHDDVLQLALQMMEEKGITRSDEYDRKKSVFEKLSKLKNFDAKFDKGEVNFLQKNPFEIRAPLSRAMGIRDLKLPPDREAGAVYTDDAIRKSWIRGQLNIFNRSKAGIFLDGFELAWDEYMKDAAEGRKQFELPLNEVRLPAPSGDGGENITGDFLKFEVNLENGGTMTGRIWFDGIPVDNEGMLKFVFWLDSNLEIFYDGSARSLVKRVDVQQSQARKSWPEKFKNYDPPPGSRSEEEVHRELDRLGDIDPGANGGAVAESTSYGKLCENWKGWVKT